MRVVLDTNVFVSAIISARGAPGRILELWQEARLDILISLPILQELDRLLHYPKLQHRYHLSEEDIQVFLLLIKKQAILVTPTEQVTVIHGDPTNNRYLECALAGQAGVLVTGDQHLLELGEYQGVHILTPAGFLAFLRLEERS